MSLAKVMLLRQHYDMTLTIRQRREVVEQNLHQLSPDQRLLVTAPNRAFQLRHHLTKRATVPLRR
jgi:hypothetical protein